MSNVFEVFRMFKSDLFLGRRIAVRTVVVLQKINTRLW